jgi:hypothetical protein
MRDVVLQEKYPMHNIGFRQLAGLKLAGLKLQISNDIMTYSQMAPSILISSDNSPKG